MPKGIQGFQKGHLQLNTGRTHFKKGHPAPKTAFKKGHIPWLKNKKHTEKAKKNMSLARKGKFCGSKHPMWEGGKTKLHIMIRVLPENSLWRSKVFQRDNYTCQKCGFGKSGDFEAHHKIAFRILLAQFLNKYNQFSPIEDKETLVRLAITYEPFWDINKGGD